MKKRCVLLLIVGFLIEGKFGASYEESSRLLEKLLSNYDNRIRPVKERYNETLKVKFKLYFNQILDVSEVSQKLESKLFLSHAWEDKRLAWKPDDYGGTKTLHIPAEQLWLPVFVLYNNADGDFGVSQFTKVKVSSNGTLEWRPPVIFKSICEIQVADFPFDTQNCTMKLGPWTDDNALIDMVNSDGQVKDHKCDHPDLESFELSGEWNILSVGCYKHYVSYDCCPQVYIDFTYHFILQRKPLYLIINILFPTMLFSLLTCAVFYLPSDAGEKMTLSISLLLSLIVFLLVIVEAIPSTANGVPLLCQYIVFTMILVSLSIMTTVAVLNIHYRGPATHVMSDRIKKIFMIILPKFMLSSSMKRMDPYEDEKNESTKYPSFCRDISELSGRDEVFPKHLIGNDVRQAVDEVNFLAQHFMDQADGQKKEDQWKYVAMVIDHFLFYVFMAVCIFGTIIIFGNRIREYGLEEKLFKENNELCLLNCQRNASEN